MATKRLFSSLGAFAFLAALLLVIGVVYSSAKFLTSAKAYMLPIPFSAQAPNDNWDRNEDCEETSIAMVNSYLTGNTSEKLPADAVEEAINNLKSWENQHIGYNANTGVEATTAMAEGAFGLKIKQINNYDEQDLKKELQNKHPILLPINARLLNNPKYKNSGPLYHMLVVRGYEGDVFIVNDPGTDSGEANKYTFEVLKNAATDWNEQNKVLKPNTKVALIVVGKNG